MPDRQTARLMRISCEHPQQPEIVCLVEQLDAYQTPLYPPESHHGIDFDALAAPNVIFAVARTEDARAVACGAMVLGPQYGELKRMFVHPDSRGQGIGRAILAFLEAAASAQGCRLFALETGVSQPAALALYASAGYVRGGPFGDYAPDPLSVFMTKCNTGQDRRQLSGFPDA